MNRGWPHRRGAHGDFGDRIAHRSAGGTCRLAAQLGFPRAAPDIGNDDIGGDLQRFGDLGGGKAPGCPGAVQHQQRPANLTRAGAEGKNPQRIANRRQAGIKHNHALVRMFTQHAQERALPDRKVDHNEIVVALQ